MSRFVLLSAVAFLMGCATHQSGARPEFVLYPGLHGEFLNPVWRFSLADLMASIEGENLDGVCVEISPGDFRNDFEGYYPPEAAAVAEALGNKLPVIPVDWRAPHSDYKEMSQSTSQKLNALKNQFTAKLESAPSRISFVISPEGEKLIKNMHDTIIDQDGEASDGFWTTRNQKITANCLERSREIKARRVGILLGIDHLYAVKANIQASGYSVQYGKLDRTSESVVSRAVVQRWIKNLRELKKLREASVAKASEIDQSRRIEQLSKFVGFYGDD